MTDVRLLRVVLLMVAAVGLTVNPLHAQEGPSSPTVPGWAKGAVFYQIFPERFRNGDPSNDPTRASLATPREEVPSSWRVTPWTRNWYEQGNWERRRGGGFYNGVYSRRYGGDLQGVIDRLPYLDSLGVDAIYFNPLFWSNSLHKYDGNTFHHIDPHFGPDPAGDKALIADENPTDPSTWHVTAADSLFFTLLDRAHARDLRVIIDGVFNHTSPRFFAFEHLRTHQADSKYADWYVVRSFDDAETPDTSEFDYQGWWGLDSMPEFANNEAGTTLHPGPRRYIMRATERWMDPNGDGNPSDGVDGWRLDVTEEVPVGFWADWNARVREINPDAYTVTEIWGDPAEFIREGGFSASMNYHGHAVPAKAYLIDQGISAPQFASMLEARRTAVSRPVQQAMLNLMDSHDTPRLASMIVNRRPADTSLEQYGYDREAGLRSDSSYAVRKPNGNERALQRLTGLFQMTYPGAPMLYYGTESGMWGADDPDDRKPMVWDDMSYEVEDGHPFGEARPADSVGFNHDLFSFYRSAIALRHQHAALRTGSMEMLRADDAKNVVAYRRSVSSDTVTVVLNRSPEARTIALSVPMGGEVVFATRRDRAVEVSQGADGLRVRVPGRTGVVLAR
jgi:glycosidase